MWKYGCKSLDGREVLLVLGMVGDCHLWSVSSLQLDSKSDQSSWCGLGDVGVFAGGFDSMNHWET